MAGIEKMSELSGEHFGWAMYGYKRNHIQVTPSERKLFRGADAELHIFESNLVWMTQHGGYRHIDKYTWNNYKRWKRVDISFDEYVKNYAKLEEPYSKGKVIKEYVYALVVKNPELQGHVKGVYLNQTFNLKQTKKRLTRMLRAYGKLEVVNHEESFDEWKSK